MSILVTMPGTDTNVTPDIEAPTMPKATMYHGDLRLPRKKVSLSELLLVRRLKIYSAVKYISIVVIISMVCFSLSV